MKILDMSAGKRAMWFNKNNSLTTYLDLRSEVEPTVVCDTRHIPDKVGTGFNLVVFDPPHVNFGANAEMTKQYGHHTSSDIRDIIKGSAAEAWKVSTEQALMAFKWNDHDQKLEKVLKLMEPWWIPLFGQLVAQKTRHASSTYWTMLLRDSTAEFL